MQFDSFANFVAMGGYGFYIWAVYGLSVVVLIANIVVPRRTMKRIQFEQQAFIARENLAEKKIDSGEEK